MDRGGIWERAIKVVDEALFPSGIYCISCGSLIDGTRPYSLCDKCIREFHWINGRRCRKCGKALQDTYKGQLCYDCMAYPHYFDKGYSCMTYGLKERELLLDYKYNGKSYLGKKFGDILYDRMSCENIDADVIIPVPIHRRRERKRGYNQSALMAESLAKKMEKPFLGDAVVRTRETALLRSLSPVERESALRGAFAVCSGALEKVYNKKVLLIDDIYTTGSTADSCSKTLLEAGAEAVLLLTLASGGNKKPVQYVYDSGL
ncbi:MAG: ComF family protein [Clostridiales bacterium]|nr:ComF family protein [Clostridiales bacterium]